MDRLKSIKQNLNGDTTEFIQKFSNFLDNSQYFLVEEKLTENSQEYDINNTLRAIAKQIGELISNEYKTINPEGNSTIFYSKEKLSNDLNGLINDLKNEGIARLEYSMVSQLVLKIKNNNSTEESSDIPSDYFDNFIIATKEELLNFIKNCEQNGSINEYEEPIICFYKLIEHTSLANMQFNELYLKSSEEIRQINNDFTLTKNSMDEWFDGTAEYLVDSEERVSKISEITENLETKYKNLNIEIVSVLGIFSSIIFAVFGGVSQLGALGGAMEKVDLSKIFIFIGASSFVLQTLVFMSFNATALLTERDMRSCGCKKSDKCKHGFTERYPIYTYASLFSLCIFILGICITIFRK
ncbi:hypothetical protein QFE98_02925 [Streptococcus uberis]|uniref:hypothetical protein n=1 Tax=Streptococcus uberis TaxID=1349 RepID=UPI0038922433